MSAYLPGALLELDTLSSMSSAEHPGQFLRFLLFEEEMLVDAAAERTGLTKDQLKELIAGHADITAESANKLSKLAGTKAQFWLKLQADYDATAGSR